MSENQCRVRGIPGKNKHADGFAIRTLVFGDLSGDGILVLDTPQAVIAGDLPYHGVEKNGDFLVVSGLVCHGGRAGKVIFSYQNGHMPGKFRQKNTFLRRRKAAADDKNILIPEKRAVAGSAV